MIAQGFRKGPARASASNFRQEFGYRVSRRSPRGPSARDNASPPASVHPPLRFRRAGEDPCRVGVGPRRPLRDDLLDAERPQTLQRDVEWLHRAEALAADAGSARNRAPTFRPGSHPPPVGGLAATRGPEAVRSDAGTGTAHGLGHACAASLRQHLSPADGHDPIGDMDEILVRSVSGRSRCSGQFGMCSYNINPWRNSECVRRHGGGEAHVPVRGKDSIRGSPVPVSGNRVRKRSESASGVHRVDARRKVPTPGDEDDVMRPRP